MPAEGVMKTRLFSFFVFISMIWCALGAYGSGKNDTAGKAGGSSAVGTTAAGTTAVGGEITVYAYDSFTADWGPGPELVRLFQKKTGVAVNLVSCGDAAQVLSRAVLERKKPVADVLIGIDNNLADRARAENVLKPYKPAGADSVVAKELVLADDWLLTPYDWGYFAIIFDTASGLQPPARLEDLAADRFAKKLILMDPRMSTPGLGFLAWTMAVYGDAWQSYWERLKPSILTMAPGWDTGYGLFTSGEAPLVISYTTSPAYHVEYDNTDRYQALIFEQGHIAQIEGVGLAKGAQNPAAAKAFIDFMLSDEAQSVLPLTQWMYPVSKTVALPDSFRAAPAASTMLAVPSSKVSAAVEQVISVLAK